MSKNRKSYVTFPTNFLAATLAPDESYMIVECEDAFYKLTYDGNGFVKEHIRDKEKLEDCHGD